VGVLKFTLALGSAAILAVGACHSGDQYSDSACTAAMTAAAARARADGRPPEADPSAFLPTIEACPTLEQWAQSAKTARVHVRDVGPFVAQVCAKLDVHLQEKVLCQQTHGLVPFG
jgi:hypothetical protein